MNRSPVSVHPALHSLARLSAALALVLAGALGALEPSAPPVDVEWRGEGPALGNIADVARDPSHPDTLYIATENSGVWRSDDGGATWLLPGDEMTSRDVSWVAVSPGEPATVWASVATDDGARLWRSFDRGATWETVDGPVQPGGDDLHFIGQRLAFFPAGGKKGAATIWMPATNLHYRSDDGGKSWSEFRVPDQDAYVFAVDPRDPKVVYAGGRGERHQLSRSDDGGRTWKAAGKGLPEASVDRLLIDPTSPSRLYAISGQSQLSTSVDRGETWTALSTPASVTDDTYALVADPSEAGVLWLAGDAGLHRSGDGGQTWNRRDDDTGRYVCQALSIDPRDSRRLVTGTGGSGLYRSRDGGLTWSPSNGGIQGGWIEAIYAAPRGGAIFAQTTVGFFRRSPGGAWSEIQRPFSDGDEAHLAGILFDRGDPQKAWAFADSSLYRSIDGGERWEAAEVEGPKLREQLRGETSGAEFAALAQDPSDPRSLYAGSWSDQGEAGAVFRSRDGGKSWKRAGKGIEGKAVKRLFAVAKETVLAVVDDSKLYRTSNGGASWSRSDIGLPDAELRQIASDPTRAANLYLASADGLFRSIDAGQSWERVSEGWEDEDVEAVAVSASGDVFGGTFRGVEVSRDSGKSWTLINEGLPNTDVRALALGGEPVRLWAGTAGNGVWSIAVP